MNPAREHYSFFCAPPMEINVKVAIAVNDLPS